MLVLKLVIVQSKVRMMHWPLFDVIFAGKLEAQIN